MGRIKDTMIDACSLLDDIKNELDVGDAVVSERLYNRYIGALMMCDKLTDCVPIRVTEDGYHEFRYDLPKEENVYWNEDEKQYCYRTEES